MTNRKSLEGQTYVARARQISLHERSGQVKLDGRNGMSWEVQQHAVVRDPAVATVRLNLIRLIEGRATVLTHEDMRARNIFEAGRSPARSAASQNRRRQ